MRVSAAFMVWRRVRNSCKAFIKLMFFVFKLLIIDFVLFRIEPDEVGGSVVEGDAVEMVNFVDRLRLTEYRPFH